jgi:ferredoxin
VEKRFMETKLFWFSGTGNSLYLARRLAERLGEAALVPIARAIDEPGEPADCVGVVCPVYALGLPDLVARFLEVLPARPDSYIFLALTYGAEAGATVGFARRRLGKRGLELSAAVGTTMPDNYPPFGGAPEPDRQTRMLEDSESQIAAAASALARRERVYQVAARWPMRVLGRIVWPMFRGHLPKTDRKFTADATCTACGLCMRICPVGDILADEAGRPQWQGHCQQCFACFHWCPVSAIQYGKHTADQHRYHHPAIKANEMTARE